MMKETKGVIKRFTYQLNGKSVSKSTPGAAKVESKNWYVTYYGKDGVQRFENSGTDNFDVALALRNRRVVETEDGKTPVADLKSLRYEDLRGAYLRQNPKQENYSGLKHLDSFFKNLKVDVRAKVTSRIQDFIEHRRDEDEASDPTIRRNLTMLRAMFNLARKKGKIGANDVPYFPMPADSDPAGEYISPEEFQTIKGYLPANLHLFFEFMYGTGCRLGALRQITWDMVNQDCGFVSLPAQIVKTKKALLVPVPESVAKELRTKFRVEGQPVFDFTNYRPEWAKAVAKAGLGTWDKKTRKRTGRRIHDCRCSAAINLLASGVDEGTVLKIGGWKTRKMLDRYNVQHMAILQAAMKKRDEYVSAKQKKA